MKCLPVLIFVLLGSFVQIARADGGAALFQQNSASFSVTLFSTEIPLRPGLADFSVLLEQLDGRSLILDAQVSIELEHESGTIIRTEATRSQARNKLLYCSLINLPKSGKWKVRLHVTRGESSTEVLGDLLVAAPEPVLVSYWKLFALPPITITLFIINQWLRRKRLN